MDVRGRFDLRRLVGEPLVHFLLLGAGIFALYARVSEPADRAPGNRIVLTAADLERLRETWKRSWQREPVPEELTRLVREHVRDEVIYREALALGLDRDDPAIRRLLRQKYEFLIQDLTATQNPSPGDLTAFYDANRERYRLPGRVTFAQVYFSTDRRGAVAEEAARGTLAALRTGSGAPDLGDVGDPSLLEREHRDRTTEEIAAMFGPEFASALLELDAGVWSGPVDSAYGLHLVLLEERTPATVPPLAEIETRVRNDWAFRQRQLANDAIFRQIFDRYEVIFDGAAPVPLADADGGAAE